MGVSGQFQVQAILPQIKNPWNPLFTMHSGPSDDLDALEKKQISCPIWE